MSGPRGGYDELRSPDDLASTITLEQYERNEKARLERDEDVKRVVRVEGLQREPVGVSWRDEANCRHIDTGLFFSPKGNVSRVQLARQVCAGCVVRSECLEEALANGERFGVFGGMTPKERKAERRRRREAAA